MKRIISLLLAVVLILSQTFVVYAEEEESGPSFQIAFLDVGEGDAAVITCDGYAMMVDGGPSAASDKIYSYLKAQGLERLDYIVCTHPDADHCGGIAGALNYAQAGILFCTEADRDIEAFQDVLKYAEKQKNRILIPDAGDVFSLGSAKVTVLAPQRGVRSSDNTSIVLRIVYGETSFLFTGDAEIPDEKALMETGAELKSTVLKVGHHGSSSSTGEEFLKEVRPEYAVIPVGGDNTYGHPTQEVLDRLKDAGVSVYRTDMEGTVFCESDGKNVTFRTEKSDDIDPFSAAGGIINMKDIEKAAEEAEKEAAEAERAAAEESASQETQAPPSMDYIANTNTHVFHRPTCPSVKRMSEKNKWYFTGTRDELIDAGYDPCHNCNP